MTTQLGRLRPALVTGAAGFIGSHLVEDLLARGVPVRGVDRRAPWTDRTAKANLGAALHDPRFQFIEADVTRDDLTAAAEGCDTVFHLAGAAGVRRSWGDQFAEHLTDNIVATHRVLDACTTAGVRRLVFASSSSVYGPSSRPSRETDPTMPVSPYGVTKLAAEQLCLAYAKRPGSRLSVVALRYFTVYGPRQRADMAVSRMLFAALTGAPWRLYGDGRQTREYTYVSDVVAATVAAARADVPTAVVNVSGGASVSNLDLIDMVRRVTGEPVPVTRSDPQPGDVPATVADLTTARLILGYRPMVDLATGLHRQARWIASLDRDLRAELGGGAAGPLAATAAPALRHAYPMAS